MKFLKMKKEIVWISNLVDYKPELPGRLCNITRPAVKGFMVISFALSNIFVTKITILCPITTHFLNQKAKANYTRYYSTSHTKRIIKKGFISTKNFL